MLILVAPISALLIGVALLLLGSGLLNTLLALRGGIEGYSSGTLGFIMSGYFAGYFVGTFLALPLIQRIGHIRTFAFCAAVASSSVLLHSLFVDPYVWLGLRVLTGAALVVLYTVIESWLNGQTSSQQRGQIFSVYMVVNLVSLALAQQLLRLDSPATFVLFALAAMLVTLSLVPVTWTRLAQPETSVITRLKFKQLYAIAPVAVSGAFLSGLAMGAFWGLAAVYGGLIGLDNNGIATFISCAILGGALFQYPVGRYSDRHDRRKVLAFVCATATLAAAILAALSFAGYWVLVAIAIYGGLAFTIYPVAVAHLVDHLESDEILSGGSSLLLLHGVGAALGPALAGQAMGLLGPQALPLFFALMNLMLALYAWWRIKRQKVDTLEHPSQFVAMVRTTPTALEMVPDEEIILEPEVEITTPENR